MYNNFNIKSRLESHLVNYGLRFFNSIDDYNLWFKSQLNSNKIADDTKKKYLNYIYKNNKYYSYKLPLEFYDLIANNQILFLITLSMKSKDILLSGNSIIKSLRPNSNILDFGCSLGYLTSFYSTIIKDLNAIGYDESKKSIDRASKLFHKKKYPNLTFTSNINKIKHEIFDYIVDTQCLCNLNLLKLYKTLGIIFPRLDKNGMIISISNLPNENIARKFLKVFIKNGFFLNELNPLIIKNINGLGVYTKMNFQKINKNKSFDIDLYYKALRRKVSVMNLFNFI